MKFSVLQTIFAKNIPLCFGECIGITYVDSTCIPVCHNKRIKLNKVFKDVAEVGKSTMGWYYGFRLHLVCNDRGELLNFCLTKANVDDRNPEVFNVLHYSMMAYCFFPKKPAIKWEIEIKNQLELFV